MCSFQFNLQSKCSPRYFNRSSKIPRTTLRLQVKLERTHRQKKKTNGLKNKRDQLFNRKKSNLSLEKKITHLQSSNQTYMELRNRIVGLRQQVRHSHHADPNPKFSEP